MRILERLKEKLYRIDVNLCAGSNFTDPATLQAFATLAVAEELHDIAEHLRILRERCTFTGALCAGEDHPPINFGEPQGYSHEVTIEHNHPSGTPCRHTCPVYDAETQATYRAQFNEPCSICGEHPCVCPPCICSHNTETRGHLPTCPHYRML